MPETLARRVENTEVAAPENDTPGTVGDTVLDHVEKPLEVSDTPYVIELLELGEAVDHFEMGKLTKDIDRYAKEELKHKDVKLSREAYKELIDSYLAKLKLPDGVSIYTKVEQLHKLMGINCRLLQAAKEKQEFLEMNPADMTSSQLRRYLSENV